MRSGSVADAHVAVSGHACAGQLGVVEAGGHVHVVDATEHAATHGHSGRTGGQASCPAVAAIAASTAVTGVGIGVAAGALTTAAAATVAAAAVAAGRRRRATVPATATGAGA